ncbi:hypothetical protein P3T76_001712 [Phytophthora citrophthora]|uniref:Uncharacterized protein n=1 Tax=Phytophthora citrophthora TaxID=4793 RepID=A0AAD9GZN0_9STRA|nr:hypothetical protein P3T76_001712 [Phytophthora citrophthora]
MDIKQESETGDQALTPASPSTGRERIGMPDDAEETSNTAGRERGGGTETGINPPVTGVTTAELMHLLRGVTEQLVKRKESHSKIRAPQLAKQKRYRSKHK